MSIIREINSDFIYCCDYFAMGKNETSYTEAGVLYPLNCWPLGQNRSDGGHGESVVLNSCSRSPKLSPDSSMCLAASWSVQPCVQ